MADRSVTKQTLALASNKYRHSGLGKGSDEVSTETFLRDFDAHPEAVAEFANGQVRETVERTAAAIEAGEMDAEALSPPLVAAFMFMDGFALGIHYERLRREAK